MLAVGPWCGIGQQLLGALYSDNFNASKTLQSIPNYVASKSDAMMSVIMDSEFMGFERSDEISIDMRLEQNWDTGSIDFHPSFNGLNIPCAVSISSPVQPTIQVNNTKDCDSLLLQLQVFRTITVEPDHIPQTQKGEENSAPRYALI